MFQIEKCLLKYLTCTTLMTQHSERGKVRKMRTMEMTINMWAHIP